MKTPIIEVPGILTPKQEAEVTKIFNETPNALDRLCKLKAYFDTFAPELEAKGVPSHYLAYALEYGVTEAIHRDAVKMAERN